MGFTYEELEQLLNGEVKNISPEKIDRIKHLMAISAHKGDSVQEEHFI